MEGERERVVGCNGFPFADASEYDDAILAVISERVPQ